MTTPQIGPFRRGDSRSGEIEVRTSANGPVTTVILRQVTASASWWVLGASTPDIQILSPSTLQTVRSPLVLRGRSTAYEAVVNGTLYDDSSLTPLREFTVLGGSMGIMGPFRTTITFRAHSQYGGLVLYVRSAKDGSVIAASAIRVLY
jgi:Immunoglobulin-like domain of bacterial spore germination